MNAGGPLRLLRSPLGQALAAGIGLAIVALVIFREGPATVWRSTSGAALYIPFVVALEAGVLCCSMLGLRSLYGSEARTLPLGLLVRAGLVGYAVMSLVPAGRAVAEASRAAILAPRVGSARAAVAALRIQGAALLGNTVASFGSLLGFLRVPHGGGMAWAVAANGVVTLVSGAAVLWGSRRLKLGGLLGRLLPSTRDFGAAFDSELGASAISVWPAVAFETLGRGLQTLQNAVLVVAVGGALGLVPTLVSEGIHLVGTTLGDLVPAQLGATEANYAVTASLLSLPENSAVAIGLLAHLAQLILVVISLVAILAWPRRRPPEPIAEAVSP